VLTHGGACSEGWGDKVADGIAGIDAAAAKRQAVCQRSSDPESTRTTPLYGMFPLPVRRSRWFQSETPAPWAAYLQRAVPQNASGRSCVSADADLAVAVGNHHARQGAAKRHVETAPVAL